MILIVIKIIDLNQPDLNQPTLFKILQNYKQNLLNSIIGSICLSDHNVLLLSEIVKYFYFSSQEFDKFLTLKKYISPNSRDINVKVAFKLP